MKMIVMKSGLRAVLAGATALAALTLAGCGGSAANGTGGGKLDVVASFYPLEFIARTVGGDAVNVTTLTAPGVEPHDLELTPKQVGEIAGAKLVVFEKNLQPAVDEAVEQNAKDAGFDIAPAAQLEATGADFEEHEEGTAAPAAHKDNALDPHFWLDPVRYAAVVKAVEEKLASVDSANAAGYHERAKALLDQVGKLDTEFKTGLASCKLKTFVTSHEAFAYLAKRYGLTMVGIAGFTPDAEPAPAAHTEDALDPHFWLDPVRYAEVVNAVTEKLVATDSANAEGYHARAKTLLAEIGKLNADFKTGLADCRLKTFVTSHQAFAYLAKRYGLTMVGIAGFTPDAEPTPARIKEVQDIVKAQHVTTIFYEELVSPKVAETIARDVGVQTAVLSPIEGLSDANSQETYLTLMQENLQELRKANGCS